jgi:hypothetical protein
MHVLACTALVLYARRVHVRKYVQRLHMRDLFSTLTMLHHPLPFLMFANVLLLCIRYIIILSCARYFSRRASRSPHYARFVLRDSVLGILLVIIIIITRTRFYIFYRT